MYEDKITQTGMVNIRATSADNNHVNSNNTTVNNFHFHIASNDKEAIGKIRSIINGIIGKTTRESENIISVTEQTVQGSDSGRLEHG